MSFETVAKQIIKKSIVSSVYIDDKVVEPFETPKTKTKYFEVSKGLYSSFKKENRSIDFYRFRLRKDWKKDSEYLFKNRDLLILDWQLNDATGLIQQHTLEILQKAVEADNLHFVSIYTETDSAEFSNIFYSIKAFFTKEYTAATKAICEEFKDYIEDLGLESYDLIEGKRILKEVALGKNEGNEDLEAKKTSIRSELGREYGNLCKELKKINSNPDTAIEVFGYYINEEICNDTLSGNCKFNFDHIDNNFIVINHTIVKLSNKKEPRPKDFFADFTDAMLKICANPLTLTSLEIRSLIKEGSGFIGKDADSISDAALFHHKQTKADSFFDFIIDIWKSYLFSYIDINANLLESLSEDFWEKYKRQNKIRNKIASLKKNQTEYHTELAKLNIYYNIFHLERDKSDITRFGDIFVEVNEDGVPLDRYWLNITAHCDCLRPAENIKNNFYFISGKQKELKKALKEADREHNSYLKVENDIVSIGWNNRPVILNIPTNKMTDFILDVKDGKLREFKLMYIATLKENYAQRMANNSFSFAMRVGIDFAGL